MLSALGFGAVIHPAGKHHGAAQPPGPPVGMIQADPSWHQGAGAGAESHFSPMDVFADLLSSHVVLNNAGYNAVDDAQDSIPWTGTLGTAHLPVAFSPATTPQNTLTRNLF
ncbi:MAG TPA: hypothetical protein VHM90_09595, partial [Phycisphaerae bacterium]|nr:hypothetical protein [Phycisphaerae bacterium]